MATAPTLTGQLHMTGTGRFLGRIAVFLGAVVVVAGVAHGLLLDAFVANPSLNGMILGVLVLGIAFIIRQIVILNSEIAWVEAFQRGQPAPSASVRLLAPMASMIGNRQGRLSLSASGTRALLDTIGARLDEGREIARYLIGLLILLGLLGTFYGLMQTVGSVGDVVGRLSAGGDSTAAFEDLKRGLATPLSAMGTAFSSSLFGLAGSLVLGFLDLQAGQAQNRFYNELEEYLAGQTRIGGSGAVADGEASVPAYIQALLETTAESLETLTRTMSRGEDSRAQTNQNLTQLVDKLSQLNDLMRAQSQMQDRVADAQLDLKPMLQRLTDQIARSQGGGVDEATRGHLRNLDLTVQRLVDEQARGRQETIAELRAEIRLVTKTIAALAEEADR